jgi:hypothetical protein
MKRLRIECDFKFMLKYKKRKGDLNDGDNCRDERRDGALVCFEEEI